MDSLWVCLSANPNTDLISFSVCPLAPSYAMEKASDMLYGEKNMSPLSFWAMFDNKKNANVLLALTGPLDFCMASFIEIPWYSIKAAGVLLVFSYCSAIGIVGLAAPG